MIAEMTNRKLLERTIQDTLRKKPQGHVFRFPLGRELFPLMSTPDLEIILLDPEEKTVAYRRVSNPLKGKPKKTHWSVNDLKAVVDEILGWQQKMLETKNELNCKHGKYLD